MLLGTTDASVEHLRRAVEAMGLIQIDSVNVLTRRHVFKDLVR